MEYWQKQVWWLQSEVTMGISEAEYKQLLKNMESDDESGTFIEVDLSKRGQKQTRKVRRSGVTTPQSHGKETSRILQDIAMLGLPSPTLEYRFTDERRWKFDLAWPDLMIACEIEGGTWMRTKTGRGKGHAHPVRFESDCYKYTEASLLGWTLIRVTPKMVRNGDARDFIFRAITQHKGK